MPENGASQAAIEHHYDVGREFYRLWLDPSLTYSCALWPDGTAPDDDLDGAQEAKLAWHAGRLGLDELGPPRRVLDVGCGWGSMLRHLSTRHGIEDLTGLTLSADQSAHVAATCPEATVELLDWRDHRPSRPYGAIVSIGAFEHFARPEHTVDQRRGIYGAFFERCWSWLELGGRLSLQTIAMEDEAGGEGAVHDFLSNDIFPESQLPRLADIVSSSDRWFRTTIVRSDPSHYEHTLHLWQQRLEARKDEAIDLAGRDTYRRYIRYLRVCRAMFDRGTCTLYRIGMRRRDHPERLAAALGAPARTPGGEPA